MHQNKEVGEEYLNRFTPYWNEYQEKWNQDMWNQYYYNRGIDSDYNEISNKNYIKIDNQEDDKISNNSDFLNNNNEKSKIFINLVLHLLYTIKL